MSHPLQTPNNRIQKSFKRFRFFAYVSDENGLRAVPLQSARSRYNRTNDVALVGIHAVGRTPLYETIGSARHIDIYMHDDISGGWDGATFRRFAIDFVRVSNRTLDLCADVEGPAPDRVVLHETTIAVKDLSMAEMPEVYRAARSVEHLRGSGGALEAFNYKITHLDLDPTAVAAIAYAPDAPADRRATFPAIALERVIEDADKASRADDFADWYRKVSKP